ncbi:enoyl-CoA hydratase/isomerase family protein [Orrella sp. JC864]|uniref:enoyl-CoA hydratase/isomerase family protein n=1 Tax=Orrella sp. JC864 TaxID=3120298 RepID=UPI003007F6EB
MSAGVRVRREQGIAVITISRPEKRNAFDQGIREGLARALQTHVQDEDCPGIILTGDGKHFSAGGDVDALARMSHQELAPLLDAAHRCVTLVREAGKPVLAAVEGYAAGGAVGLALACDAIVAARDARFVFPFLRIGLVPDWGCVHLLRSKAGDGAARRLLLRPSDVPGAEALELGIADMLAEPGMACATAMDLMRQYLALPAQAWGHTKAMLNAQGLTLAAALEQERQHQDACFRADAFKPRLAARLKRKPDAA